MGPWLTDLVSSRLVIHPFIYNIHVLLFHYYGQLKILSLSQQSIVRTLIFFDTIKVAGRVVIERQPEGSSAAVAVFLTASRVVRKWCIQSTRTII